MILPPFFGFPIPSKDQEPYRIHYSYIGEDVQTFNNVPKNISIATYLGFDTVTYLPKNMDLLSVLISTYCSDDTFTFKKPDNILIGTYQGLDCFTYKLKPIPPSSPINILADNGDTFSDIIWNPPKTTSSLIKDYIIEYTLASSFNLLTEDTYPILSEQENFIVTENENSSTIPSWILFNDPISADTYSRVSGLINGSGYIFRVSSVNSAGTGSFGYSNYIVPTGVDQSYQSISLYLKFDDNFNDLSCNSKPVYYIASNINSLYISDSEFKYGEGSLYLSGEADNETYVVNTVPHLYVYPNIGTSWNLAGDFTIELWIKPLSNGSNKTLAESYSNNNNYWRLSRNVSRIEFTLKTNNEPLNSIYSNNDSVLSNMWTHIAVTRSFGKIKLFINGIQQGNIVLSNKYPNLTESDKLLIGAGTDYDNSVGGDAKDGFDGYIDNFIITKAAKYRFNFTPTEYIQPYDC